MHFSNKKPSFLGVCPHLEKTVFSVLIQFHSLSVGQHQTRTFVKSGRNSLDKSILPLHDYIRNPLTASGLTPFSYQRKSRIYKSYITFHPMSTAPQLLSKPFWQPLNFCECFWLFPLPAGCNIPDPLFFQACNILFRLAC